MTLGFQRKHRNVAAIGAAFSMCLLGSTTANSAEKVLYAFQGGNDGAHPPDAGVIADDAGDMFGVTGGGGGTGCEGEVGCGTVFELMPGGAETVLYAFGGGCDGASPDGRLTVDSSGNLYGVTVDGGSCNDRGFGTVFKLTPTGAESILHAFKSGADGSDPNGALVQDKKGNLFGATALGGGGSGCDDDGCGTIFEITPKGKETVLYAFCPEGSCADGAEPFGDLILDRAGDLFGAAGRGGGGTNCGPYGCGAVFKLAPDGTETVLYVFTGGSDGGGPSSGLLMDKAGNVYGVTEEGGASNKGTVYRVTPDGTETALYAFQGGADGEFPAGTLIADKEGNLYGTTALGGGSGCKGSGCGTVFKVAPDGTETVLYAFKRSHGEFPAGALLLGKHGDLYGTTEDGGKHHDGVVFRVKD